MKASIYKLLLLAPLIITNICSQLFLVDVGSIELYYSLLLIFFLGIPHGAMDHVIFKKERKKASHLFTALYWTLGMTNAILWFYFPVEITFFFIIISAFHFGQAQFSTNKYLNQKVGFHIFWGMSVITLLLSKNIEQIEAFVTANSSSAFYQVILFYLENKMIFFFFLGLTLFSKMCYLIFNKINFRYFVKELFLFLTITLFMNFSTIIVGITTFFVFVHSLNVLEQEYNYLRGDDKDFSFFKFIKIIFPFSMLSYLMTGLLLLLNIYGIINISTASLLLILLSSVTLPHAVVMNIFYNADKSYNRIL